MHELGVWCGGISVSGRVQPAVISLVSISRCRRGQETGCGRVMAVHKVLVVEACTMLLVALCLISLDT